MKVRSSENVDREVGTRDIVCGIRRWKGQSIFQATIPNVDENGDYTSGGP